jgi:hypothetical protein
VTPTNYYGLRLAKLPPAERIKRLRLILGETLTAVGRKHRYGRCPNGPGAACDHGTAWTASELDGLTYALWKIGRPDSSGAVIGGALDGAAA